jgi:hypothetical protein
MARIMAGETYETEFVKFLNTIPVTRDFISRAAASSPGPPSTPANPVVLAPGRARAGGSGGSRGSEIAPGIQARLFYERRDTHYVTLLLVARSDTSPLVRSSSGSASSGRSGASLGGGGSRQFAEYMTNDGTRGAVVRDPVARHVIIDYRDTLRISLDSTLILMLDHRGGARVPRIASLAVPLLPLAVVDVPLLSPESRMAEMQRYRAVGRRDNALVRYLESIPAVREFIR